MKKIMSIALCAVMVLSLAACSSKIPPKEEVITPVEPKQPSTTLPGESTTQIPNPFVDCETLAEVEKMAGFTLTLPEKMPEGYEQKHIRGVESKMIELIYKNGDSEITVRKAKGSESISGDYTVYGEKKTIEVGDLQVETKGSDGKVNVATWTSGDYTYSISANSGGLGLDSKAMTDMIFAIQ